MNLDDQCPCGSNKKYKSCCYRYVSRQKDAPIAEALMRSRFTAFKIRDVDYIFVTWAAETRGDNLKSELSESLKTTQYHSLKILSKQAGTRKSDTGQVEFIVDYDVLGKSHQLHENSNFEKRGGKWVYVDGLIY